ncbi:sulfite exporter TauE/SafE family protein [Carboxydothermus pertinax]|uniref:Probable membrane transporter protein n=1 Tax=Carboxydothermus pertinax TaxID=870242 RepID=A0A1L8CT68_9THEO|nr:sulfite exporter TauE/SafE family protein [Carboxydothermus pertinax]GAV22111.1 anion permease [Carboxydothermus pertinax]
MGGFILAGFITGLAIGLTGVGGGSILAPLLLLLGVAPGQVVGNDLVFASITKGVALYPYKKEGKIHILTAKKLLLGSIPGGVIGIFLLEHLKKTSASSALLTHVLAGVIIAASIISLLKELLNFKGSFLSLPQEDWRVIVIGFIAGVIVGLTSIGAGILVGLYLYATGRFDSRELVGTDIFHGLILALVLGFMHFKLGNINPKILIYLILGSLPGALIGGRLNFYLSPKTVRIIFLSLTTALSLKILI